MHNPPHADITIRKVCIWNFFRRFGLLPSDLPTRFRRSANKSKSLFQQKTHVKAAKATNRRKIIFDLNEDICKNNKRLLIAKKLRGLSPFALGYRLESGWQRWGAFPTVQFNLRPVRGKRWNQVPRQWGQVFGCFYSCVLSSRRKIFCEYWHASVLNGANARKKAMVRFCLNTLTKFHELCGARKQVSNLRAVRPLFFHDEDFQVLCTPSSPRSSMGLILPGFPEQVETLFSSPRIGSTGVAAGNMEGT